jgi:hypothetical protein
VADTGGFSVDTPWSKLPKAARETVLYGADGSVKVSYRNRYGRLRSYTTTFEGVITNIERRHDEAESDTARDRLEQYMREVACRACKGARLKPESLAVTIGGASIWELTSRSIDEEVRFLDQLTLTEREQYDRGTDPARDPRPDAVPAGRRAGVPDARSRSATLAGERRSASVWPRRSAAGSWECCTSSMSPRSACTRGTIAV